MDIRKIEQLVAILEKSELQQMVIEDESGSIKLSKPKPVIQVAQQIAQQEVAVADPQPQLAQSVTPETDSLYSTTDKTNKTDIVGNAINSPMVGTFYRAPSPEAKPFVESGQEVKSGDVICIVEAMKMMNQIKADKAGKVGSILVENGEPVEYGQPLVTII